MKKKADIREKRNAEALRRKEAFSPKKMQASDSMPVKNTVPKRSFPAEASVPVKSPEEEAREFMDYLEKYDVPDKMEDDQQMSRKKPDRSVSISCLNLEDGMPTVNEAITRMRIGLQEMRVSRVKAVKLIHGYGSTGRGGKINIGVREELAAMKRKKQIRDYIPGENFGPIDQASRDLVERDHNINRDPDYGGTNHGITIVVL